MPAVGMSHKWWEKKAKSFWPERGSRLGNRNEYIAFMAIIIKELVASGWKVADAWNAVCNDSRELGHYYHFNDKMEFETTGSREVCGWYDLANAHKLLESEEDIVWCASGAYWYEG